MFFGGVVTTLPRINYLLNLDEMKTYSTYPHTIQPEMNNLFIRAIKIFLAALFSLATVITSIILFPAWLITWVLDQLNEKTSKK
jgi:hypothetical protein